MCKYPKWLRALNFLKERKIQLQTTETSVDWSLEKGGHY